MNDRSDHNAADDAADIDDLYQAMKPRLIAARRSYLRKRLAAFAVVPVLLGASFAWAQTNEPEVSQLASGGELVEAEPTPEPTPVSAEEKAEAEEETSAADEDAKVEAEAPAYTEVSLGLVGSAFVAQTESGLIVGELALEPGWSAEESPFGNSRSIMLVLTNGDLKLAATIVVGDDGDLVSKVTDISPEPTPTVQTRKEIALGDVATAVVEREEDTLWIAVTWAHEWWEPVIVTQQGERVHAYVTNDGVEKHVEAWIKGNKIKHETWVVVPEAPEEKDEPKDEKPKDEPKDEEPEVQTRKEIEVGDVGAVVVERDGEKLYLAVTWSHKWWDAVVVKAQGAKVHAYFTNDGVEKHVEAWIKGNKIKHETWVVEPEITAYDGWVSCGFGDVGVLVEGNIARVMTVEAAEGVEATILKEVGEVVRVRFTTDEAVWVLDAWGNGHEILSECGQVE